VLKGTFVPLTRVGVTPLTSIAVIVYPPAPTLASKNKFSNKVVVLVVVLVVVVVGAAVVVVVVVVVVGASVVVVVVVVVVVAGKHPKQSILSVQFVVVVQGSITTLPVVVGIVSLHTSSLVDAGIVINTGVPVPHGV
jgi:hypothetical protein